MSNPFDQFGTDFAAALPPAPEQQNMYGAPPPDAGNPYGMPTGNPYGAADANPYGLPPAPPQESPPAPMSNNPYGAYPPQEANLYGAPPPPQQDPNPYGAPPPPQDSNPYGMPPQDSNPYGLPPAPPQDMPPVPGSNPYGGAPGQQAPPPQQPEPNAYADPWGQPAPEQQAGPPPPQQPPTDPNYGAPPPSQQPPFGGAGGPNPYESNPYEQQQPPIEDPGMNALVTSQQQSNPYAAYGAPPPQHQQPYGQYGGGPPQPAFGGYDYGQPAGYGAPPPPPPAPVDPFSVFQQSEPPAPEPSTALVPSGPDPTAPDDDFWSSFGNSNAEAEAPIAAAPKDAIVEQPEEEKKGGDEGLPPGGEWYDARIFTPTLGVMFFKPQELTDSLFLNTDKDVVDALGERPVVAFIVEGSSARSAGVELGHVLLKVNGVDVRSPKEASRLIKEGPRPLPLLFYVPNTDVVIAEGEHMVKYDTKETVAPNSAKDWKPKYVVIGGIIAQPWMMNMYRSKVRHSS